MKTCWSASTRPPGNEAGSELALPEGEHLFVEVAAGRRIADTVLAPRVEHHLKLDAGTDQLVDKVQGVLRMDIVIVGRFIKASVQMVS